MGLILFSNTKGSRSKMILESTEWITLLEDPHLDEYFDLDPLETGELASPTWSSPPSRRSPPNSKDLQRISAKAFTIKYCSQE